MPELLMVLVFGGVPAGTATAWFFKVISRKEVLLGDSREALEKAESARVRAEAERRAAREAAEVAAAGQSEMSGLLGEAIDVARTDVREVGRGVAEVHTRISEVRALVAELRENGVAAGALETLGGQVEQVLSLIGAQAEQRDVTAQMREMLQVARQVQELRDEVRASLSGRDALSDAEVEVLRGLLAEEAARGRGDRPRGRHEQPGAQLYVLPGTGSGEGEPA